ncbi:hypothetical protein NBG98_23290, partial [Burkholderia cenocepacia]|uniref:hypothetical protein n=1 Tax=Burkholderia cenocepacia TaxID=95486 RepID=UPI00203BEBFC
PARKAGVFALVRQKSVRRSAVWHELGVEGVGSNRNRLLEIGQMHLARRDACTPATNVAEITNLLFFVCVGGHQGRGEKSPWTTSPE